MMDDYKKAGDGHSPAFIFRTRKKISVVLAAVSAAVLLTVFTWPVLLLRSGGDILAVLPYTVRLPLTIHFIHSVQKTPVEEDLRLDDKWGGFVLEETRYQSFGVGLPFLSSEGEFREDGDYFIFAGMGRHFRTLSLRTGVGTQLQLDIAGREYRLYDMYPPGTRIDLYMGLYYQSLI
jgi:hypothetical protein